MSNPAQMAYKNDFVQKESQIKRSSPDCSMFCIHCGAPGDTRDPHSHFDAIVPPIDSSNLRRGLMMDSIKLIWFCSICTQKLHAAIERKNAESQPEYPTGEDFTI